MEGLRPAVFDSGGNEFFVELCGPIAGTVVREDALNGDAVTLKERIRSAPEPNGRDGRFVTVDF